VLATTQDSVQQEIVEREAAKAIEKASKASTDKAVI